MLKGHERKLASFGVKFVDSGEFSGALGSALYQGIFSEPSQAAARVEPAGRPADSVTVTLSDSFITCEDLMKIPLGASVSIASGAVLTPLAKEYLENKEIKLIRL
jgi:hypothetical protein